MVSENKWYYNLISSLLYIGLKVNISAVNPGRKAIKKPPTMASIVM